MAPGVNGTGRQTGTVPKMKARNNSAEHTPSSVRDQGRNNAPNNLTSGLLFMQASLDWQQQQLLTDSALNRARKTSNSRSAGLDAYELAPESGTSNVGGYLSAQRSYPDESQGIWQPPASRRASDMNGLDCTPVESGRREQVGRSQQNVMPDKENKSNISRMPDRNQVVCRLNQIRDYIKQTSSLMNALKISGDPIVANMSAPSGSSTGQVAPSRSSGEGSLRALSEDPGGVKSSDLARHNELRIKYEESRKKLQVLQEQQVILLAQQKRAQDQLKEARAAQGVLLARAQGAGVDPAVMATAMEGLAGSTEEGDSNIQGNLQQLQERLATLSELHENRNQLAAMLGDRDEELASEHLELRDKLRELQSKKDSMNRLIAEFSELQGSQDLQDGGDSSPEPTEENGEDIEAVRDKMAELNRMKAQLAHLKGVMASVTRAEEPQEELLPELVETETAVNLRRQRDKPDNTHGMTQEIQRKEREVRETRGQLQHLQELLAHMTQRTCDDDGAGDVGRDRSTERESSDRGPGPGGEQLPFREKKTNSQLDQQLLLQAELQAKRRELEELMRKDQGQASSVNQDLSADKGYGGLAETTTAATWGGSSQGPLDELGEGQDRSAGYSSDEEEEEERSFPDPRMRGSQLINNAAQPLSQSMLTNRDVLNMSLDSGHNVASQAAPVPTPTSSRAAKQGPHFWRKHSSDSGTVPPRAVWTPQSSQPTRQENLCSAEELVTPGEVESPGQNSCWLQQQVVQLQQQLEMTSGMCQRMMMDQQHRSGSLMPWGLYGTPPPFDMQYQQLLLASQAHQQQMMMSTMQQCCQMLWLQHKELALLRTAVQALQDKRDRREDGFPLVIGQHEGSEIITSNQNSAQATPHQSQSNLSRVQQPANSTPNPYPSQHPNLKVSYSGGLFQLPGDLSTSSGVTSAHSLPNISQTMNAAPGISPALNPETNPLNNIQNFGPSPNNMGPNYIHNCPTGPLSLGFNNRSQPLSSLIQCSAPPQSSGSPWGGGAGLLPGHGTPPALNNQVPPGNRANNYWDNFRSYSRQNLLSTTTKSNEGVSHSPSPLVDRSHNTLRGPVGPGMHQPIASGSTFPVMEQGAVLNLSRKDKQNTDQIHGSDQTYVLPSSHNMLTPETNGSEEPMLGVNRPQAAGSSLDGASRNMRESIRAVVAAQINSKRKNRRPDMSQNYRACSLDSADPAEAQKPGSLFHALSDSVYSEVATLISINEGRPHFLIQLFRDLQMVSSDPLRQRTLQSIHEVVSRFLSGAHSQQDTMLKNQTENVGVRSDCAAENGATSSDEDETTVKVDHQFHLGEPLTVSNPRSAAESEEGAAALISPRSSPRNLPRNASAWSARDSLSLPLDLSERGSRADWEVQAVLLELLPFLKAHLDEMCSPGLLEAIRQLTLRLIAAQNLPLPPGAQTPAAYFFQGQLDALLEDALLKFQGCRLRDIGEELLTVIAEVLLSELTFLHLVDTVSRGDASSSDACLDTKGCSESDPANLSVPSHQSVSGSQQLLATESTSQASITTDGYNGDLAEADQSRHEDTGSAASSQGFVYLGPGGDTAEGGSQAEGEDAEESELEEAAALAAPVEEPEPARVEGDDKRELDRVPTRLLPDENCRHTPESGPPANKSDAPAP